MARDQRPYNVEYYRTHREDEIARVRVRQNATLELLRDLRGVPCRDCGGDFPPWIMQFDHREPSAKLFAVTTGSALLTNRAKLLNEIAKCDIVCANCHAVRTHEQLIARRASLPPELWAPGTSRTIERARARWKANAKFLDDLRAVPCLDCGDSFPPAAMHFDHRDPSTKRFGVTRIINRSRKLLLEEIQKCDIVCANCHADRTYWRRKSSHAGVL